MKYSERKKSYDREYRLKNIDRIKAREKAYKQANKEKYKEAQRKYRQSDKYKAWQKEYNQRPEVKAKKLKRAKKRYQDRKLFDKLYRPALNSLKRKFDLGYKECEKWGEEFFPGEHKLVAQLIEKKLRLER